MARSHALVGGEKHVVVPVSSEMTVCCCSALQVWHMQVMPIPVLVGTQVNGWQCCWRKFALTVSVWEQIVAQASESVKLGIVEVLTMQSAVWRHAIFVDNNIVNESSLLYCIWPELVRNA